MRMWSSAKEHEEQPRRKTARERGRGRCGRVGRPARRRACGAAPTAPARHALLRALVLDTAELASWARWSRLVALSIAARRFVTLASCTFRSSTEAGCSAPHESPSVDIQNATSSTAPLSQLAAPVGRGDDIWQTRAQISTSRCLQASASIHAIRSRQPPDEKDALRLRPQQRDRPLSVTHHPADSGAPECSSAQALHIQTPSSER
jgi:hypothetical protein